MPNMCLLCTQGILNFTHTHTYTHKHTYVWQCAKPAKYITSERDSSLSLSMYDDVRCETQVF